MAAPLPQDMRAGFVGLVAAVAFLLAVSYTIVHLTSASFAGHERPAAEAPH